MATINDFKREINKLAQTQKAVKRVNDCSSVYFNRGLLHAMYVAYYVLKHKLIGDERQAYYDQVRNSWKRLQTFGWCGYSGGDYSHEAWKSFMIRVDAVYGCVQGGHAVAQWLLEHPNQDWNNSYLIYLYADLDIWRFRLDLVGKDYSSFHEPDRNNDVTAIALQDDGRMFKKLKLVRE